MKFKHVDKMIMYMIAFTLVLPLSVGLLMQNYTSWSFVSIPMHSTLESMGAIIALVLSAIIFMLYHKKLEFNHFHRASFALIAMGIFDAFHAMVYPGELFVWLHSQAIFFGGILFSLVWIPYLKVNKKTYYYVPLSVLVFSLSVSIISISYPSIVPQMLNEKKEFSDAANLLNLIGGVMYIVASFYFIKKYIQKEDLDELLFAGHTMLFGSAGILFFFSALWDMSWWFWHVLRLLAYIVSFYFMLKVFYKNMLKLESSNKTILKNNKELDSANKMLNEYKEAIYQGGIISTSDLEGKITYVNDEFLKITGYKKEELIGVPHNILRDPDTPKHVFKEMWDTIQNKKIFKGLVKNRRKDSTAFYAKITVIPILNTKNEVVEYIALRDDVTELVESQKELKKHFYTDPLTGLSNRFKLSEDLTTMQTPHIALVNIDGFKNINDFYGLSIGDKLIKELSNTLLDFCYKKRYYLYRNHGDEFVVVTSNETDFTVFEAEIKQIINYVENTKINVENVELDLRVSAGLCEYCNDIVKPDIALKEAKHSKKTILKYTNNLDMQKIFESNMQWSQKIKQALVDDRIEVALQPLFFNEKKKVVKYEALVRLIEKNGKIIAPFEFLDVAKRTKLYGDITRRVIKKAFMLLNETTKEISINICAEDIFDEETKSYLLNTLKESVNSDRIVIELVESEGIENFGEIQQFLQDIKQYGVKLAIDDFGTGYSNFEYLLKLNADFIKIDGSMIKNIDSDANSYNVVETIVAFAKKNNMQTVAEFVSTKEIQEKVLELGIEYSQGYYIDKPKFFNEIEEQI